MLFRAKEPAMWLLCPTCEVANFRIASLTNDDNEGEQAAAAELVNEEQPLSRLAQHKKWLEKLDQTSCWPEQQQRVNDEADDVDQTEEQQAADEEQQDQPTEEQAEPITAEEHADEAEYQSRQVLAEASYEIMYHTKNYCNAVRYDRAFLGAEASAALAERTRRCANDLMTLVQELLNEQRSDTITNCETEPDPEKIAAWNKEGENIPLFFSILPSYRGYSTRMRRWIYPDCQSITALTIHPYSFDGQTLLIC
jgi:hypothetical protein